jgi:hypothetical protein
MLAMLVMVLVPVTAADVAVSRGDLEADPSLELVGPHPGSG